MKGVVLVGRRPDHGHRDELWRWCERRWASILPDWPVHQGLHTAEDDRPEFCLSAASNRAARAATDWDVAVYVGADWFPGTAAQVRAAAELSLALGQLVFAHDRTVVLTEQATAITLEEDFPGGDWQLPEYPRGGPRTDTSGTVHPNTFSGVLTVPRDLWQRVGGFDERFVGWGYDDLAFWSACCAVGGGFQRVEGAAIYHLWHPRSREENEGQPHHSANQVLGERYLAAKWDASAMHAILREPGGPRA